MVKVRVTTLYILYLDIINSLNEAIKNSAVLRSGSSRLVHLKTAKFLN